ncbi:MAG: UDP-N-acetylglucosamine 2-epimerase (non-hydrolyzing) [Magnetococcales bacterium]|nr:UDP-N-acetylglucosamine 2-epimerase (non-hydrolyzing) [Magnetococcales bacterium]
MKISSPVLCVVGARPNFMKMAAVLPPLGAVPDPLPTLLIHTGQHYGAAMKETFFQELGMPVPDEDLEVGSGSHAVQTAEIMQRFEPVLDRRQPRAVLVVGDVNSTIACALTAVKKGIPVIHVEAGLRSFDRTMPEEINRLLTDQIADLLFATEREAVAQLQREGIAPEKIHFVGNVMIDTLRRLLPRAPAPERVVSRLTGGAPWSMDHGYGLVTLHRPANVDQPAVLGSLLATLGRAARELPLIFPLHPRTRQAVAKAGLEAALQTPGLLATPPLSYLEMLGLLRSARVVLTDSGGLQEETTALGIPCLTLRDNTERPITVIQGTNTLVGTDPSRIATALAGILDGGGKDGRVPELWDGRAGERIAAILKARLGNGRG